MVTTRKTGESPKQTFTVKASSQNCRAVTKTEAAGGGSCATTLLLYLEPQKTSLTAVPKAKTRKKQQLPKLVSVEPKPEAKREEAAKTNSRNSSRVAKREAANTKARNPRDVPLARNPRDALAAADADKLIQIEFKKSYFRLRIKI